MECTVGVLEGDVPVLRLIENRLGVGARRLGRLEVSEAAGNYVRVEYAGKEALFALCDIFADIIMENLQIRYIMNRLERKYSYIEERDKCEILVATLKRLWYSDSGTEWLEHAKKDVSNRVAVCLLENQGGLVSLDGVIRFRMQDCTEEWRRVLEECVDEYVSESERKEFIRLLRYFVCMRDPAIEDVVISGSAEGFRMMTKRGVPIVAAQDEEEASYAEQLLSRLIALAPVHIVIKDAKSFPDSSLMELIQTVFVGRVELQ